MIEVWQVESAPAPLCLSHQPDRAAHLSQPCYFTMYHLHVFFVDSHQIIQLIIEITIEYTSTSILPQYHNVYIHIWLYEYHRYICIMLTLHMYIWIIAAHCSGTSIGSRRTRRTRLPAAKRTKKPAEKAKKISCPKQTFTFKAKNHIYFCIWLDDYILYDRFFCTIIIIIIIIIINGINYCSILYCILMIQDYVSLIEAYQTTSHSQFKRIKKIYLNLIPNHTSHQPSSTCFIPFFPSDVFDVPSFIWPSSKLRLRA